MIEDALPNPNQKDPPENTSIINKRRDKEQKGKRKKKTQANSSKMDLSYLTGEEDPTSRR